MEQFGLVMCNKNASKQVAVGEVVEGREQLNLRSSTAGATAAAATNSLLQPPSSDVTEII